jgi:hypothetical protein
MAFGLHVVEDLRNHAFFNHKRGARHAHDLLPIHVFLFDDPVLFAHGFAVVGEQGEVEVVFIPEFRLGFGRIGRDSQYGDAFFRKLFDRVAKLAGFFRSTRGIGFGVKEEHDFLVAMIGKVELFTFIGRDFEQRRLVAFLQHQFNFAFSNSFTVAGLAWPFEAFMI